MKQNKHLFRVFLAVLPVLTETGSWPSAFWGACFTAGLFLLSSAFFKITRPFFPRIFFRFAVVLFPAAAFQSIFYITEAPLVWAVSLFMLYDFKELESGSKGYLRILARSVFYLFLLSAVGFLRYFSAQKLNIAIFEHPSGILFLLAFVWVFLKGKTPALKTAGAGRE